MSGEDDRWRMLSSHRTQLDGPLTGWRFWHAGGSVFDGQPLQPRHGRRHKACLIDPLLDSSSAHLALTITGRPLPPAGCRRSPHLAPADGCTCGWRIVRCLPDLAVYLRDLHTASAPHQADIPAVIVKVRGSGVARHGSEFDRKLEVVLPAGAPPEPTRTARVERLEIVGPLLLAPSIAHAAPAFENEFRRPVRTWSGGTIWQWYDALITGLI